MEEENYQQQDAIKMAYLNRPKDSYLFMPSYDLHYNSINGNVSTTETVINNSGINYNSLLQNKGNFINQGKLNQRNLVSDSSSKPQYSLQDDLMQYLCLEGQKKQANGQQTLDSQYLNLMKQELKKRNDYLKNYQQNCDQQDTNLQGMTPMQFAVEQQQQQQMNTSHLEDQTKINYYKKMQELSQNKVQQIVKLQTDFQNNQSAWDEECKNRDDKPSLNDYHLIHQQQQQSLQKQQNLLCNSLNFFNSALEDIKQNNEIVMHYNQSNQNIYQNQIASQKEEETLPVVIQVPQKNAIDDSKNFSDINQSSAVKQNSEQSAFPYQYQQNQANYTVNFNSDDVNFMEEEQGTANAQKELYQFKEQANQIQIEKQDFQQSTHKINKQNQKRKLKNIDIDEDSQMQEEQNIGNKVIKDSINVNGEEIAGNDDDNCEKEQNENEDNQLGTLSFEEFAFSENAFKLDEQREENRLQIKYKIHPTLKPVEAFLINGEIIVSFDLFYQRKNQEHDKVSLWNMFRPINTITVKRTLVEVSMHKSQNTLTNFQPLIQRLIDMHDQQAYASAQMLQQHYVSLQREQMIKQQVFDVYGSHITQLQWQFEENFHKSKQMAYDMMDQLPEDAFFLYSIRRTDPVSLDSIFCALGYSKGLIRLIAGNESNYQQFCFRSGLAEIFNAQSRLQILLMNLLFSNKVHISITTLDDITIPIEMRVHYQKLMQTEILPGVYKEDYMKIYQILVDQKYLDEVYQIRGFSATGNGAVGNEARIIQPDYTYQMQSHRFIEKFYSEALKEKKNAIKKASEIDQRNFTAEFQRIFGKQNEGQNFLHNVFNTTIKQQSQSQSSQFTNNNENNSLGQSQQSIQQNVVSNQSQLHSSSNILNQSQEIRQKQESVQSCSLANSLSSSHISSTSKKSNSNSNKNTINNNNSNQISKDSKQQKSSTKNEDVRSRNSSSSHTLSSLSQVQNQELAQPNQIPS
ncbi:hypothetical protein ABPG74_008186 [Tetrahymena malaccensis]